MRRQRKIFADRLKQLRIDNGLTMPALAEKISVKKQAIDRLEKEQASPSFELLYSLAETLKVSADYLLGLSDDPKVHKPRKRDVE